MLLDSQCCLMTTVGWWLMFIDGYIINNGWFMMVYAYHLHLTAPPFVSYDSDWTLVENWNHAANSPGVHGLVGFGGSASVEPFFARCVTTYTNKEKCNNITWKHLRFSTARMCFFSYQQLLMRILQIVWFIRSTSLWIPSISTDSRYMWFLRFPWSISSKS